MVTMNRGKISLYVNYKIISKRKQMTKFNGFNRESKAFILFISRIIYHK